MTLADPRFAAELLTRTGKAVVFDDVGCLAAWLGENSIAVGSSWVANFAAPDQWLPADSVRVLLGGTLLTWHDLLAAPHRHAPAPTS